ncbi:AMP-binding enzyme [Nostoc sp. 'Peltigera malacea cyanobiont' DB3992]|uniref:AMP-binding enzyme n=2 Tax=Nostoc cyanobionts TaxID=3123326 RepID=UPI002FDD9865
MINVSGFKVYPTEVENVIYQHSSVAEVAVYGVKDAIKGEIVQANIILKQGYRISEEQILKFCAERMAKYKLPYAITFVDSLPKNPSGKVIKRFLRQQSSSELAVVNN